MEPGVATSGAGTFLATLVLAILVGRLPFCRAPPAYEQWQWLFDVGTAAVVGAVLVRLWTPRDLNDPTFVAQLVGACCAVAAYVAYRWSRRRRSGEPGKLP